MHKLERIIWNREYAEFSIWSEELNDPDMALTLFNALTADREAEPGEAMALSNTLTAGREEEPGEVLVKEQATVLCAVGLYDKLSERTAELQRWRAMELLFCGSSFVRKPFTLGRDTFYGVEDSAAPLARVCAIFISSWKDILWYEITDPLVAAKSRGNSRLVGRPKLFRPPEGTTGKELVFE